RGAGEVAEIARGIGSKKILSVGVIDGRNIWKNDFTASLKILDQAKSIIGAGRLIVSPSCSLIHTPLSLAYELKLDAELTDWMAFAEQKLQELTQLRGLLDGTTPKEALTANAQAISSRRQSKRIHQ